MHKINTGMLKTKSFSSFGVVEKKLGPLTPKIRLTDKIGLTGELAIEAMLSFQLTSLTNLPSWPP